MDTTNLRVLISGLQLKYALSCRKPPAMQALRGMMTDGRDIGFGSVFDTWQAQAGVSFHTTAPLPD